jgi:glycerol uptake facilitator-like aquaporin
VLLANVIFVNINTPGGESVVQAAFNGTPQYNPAQMGMFKAMAIEAVATFLLVFAVFGTAVDPRHPNVGGFGVGLTITALILFCGPLTGGAMNPARTFGTGFLMGGVFWSQQIVYWVGPIAGGVIAGLVYDACITQPKSDRA